MKIKSEKGITIIALVITIILMLILVGVGMHFGENAIDKAKLEDIKTNMISIKTKAKIIAEEYNFKDIKKLVGTPLDDSSYEISNELQNIFQEEEIQSSKLYVWTKDDLDSQGLNTINTDDTNFYIVYYNLKNTNECEVYYSTGVGGEYSLSALQDK